MSLHQLLFGRRQRALFHDEAPQQLDVAPRIELLSIFHLRLRMLDLRRTIGTGERGSVSASASHRDLRGAWLWLRADGGVDPDHISSICTAFCNHGHVRLREPPLKRQS
jgi:hypothetical protein